MVWGAFSLCWEGSTERVEVKIFGLRVSVMLKAKLIFFFLYEQVRKLYLLVTGSFTCISVILKKTKTRDWNFTLYNVEWARLIFLFSEWKWKFKWCMFCYILRVTSKKYRRQRDYTDGQRDRPNSIQNSILQYECIKFVWSLRHPSGRCLIYAYIYNI